MTDDYLGQAGIGRALGVTRQAVQRWRKTYGKDSGHPFPEPDVRVDETAEGWKPGRLDEIREWRKTLPGQGAGGGRPRRHPAKQE